MVLVVSYRLVLVSPACSQSVITLLSSLLVCVLLFGLFVLCGLLAGNLGALSALGVVNILHRRSLLVSGVSRLGSCRSRPPRRLCRRKLALEKDLLQRTRTLINPTSSVSKCLETQMNNNENISKCSCFCQQDVFSSRKFGTGLFSWRRGEKNPSAASLLRTSV